VVQRPDHELFVVESPDLSPAELRTCSVGGGNAYFPHLLNGASGETERIGGGGWALTGKQFADAAGGPGWDSPPLVDLLVFAPLNQGGQQAIECTTGEARVLAAHLLALCDRLDDMT
jgi:hypothetical protein